MLFITSIDHSGEVVQVRWLMLGTIDTGTRQYRLLLRVVIFVIEVIARALCRCLELLVVQGIITSDERVRTTSRH